MNHSDNTNTANVSKSFEKLSVVVTNDDGIRAPGIAALAAIAARFGDVTVVAPTRQCSVSSMKLTLDRPMLLSPANDFPVPGVAAYALDGTPTDCVRVALSYLFRDKKPDLILSGMNCGYNSGMDIAYSATVGAAMESVLRGVPAIAVSCDFGHGENIMGTYSNGVFPEDYDCAARFLPDILEKLITMPRPDGVWNVNIPTVPPDECAGVWWDRTVSHLPYVDDIYEPRSAGDTPGSVFVGPRAVYCTKAEPGSDIDAELHNAVSVGFVPLGLRLRAGTEYQTIPQE